MEELTLFDKKQGDFYDKWESVFGDQKKDIINSKIQTMIDHAKNNTTFYKDKLEGFKPDSDFPLKNVGILKSSDLKMHIPPQGNDLVSKKTLAHTVFQSGGTTGVPKTSLFSHQELERLNKLNARGFYATGLNKEDRVANLWAVGGLYMTFVHINRILQQYGCQNFPFSNHTPNEFINTVRGLFNINVFSGISSVVLNNLRAMYEDGHRFEIEKVYFGGEHLFKADEQELRSKFGVKKILAPGYGTVDTWYIGYQCEQTPLGTFHTHDDECYVEILDDDGNECAQDEVGMLHATALTRFLTPIIRYQVGDKAKWNSTKCPCGRQTPTFTLLGRGDDVLRIGYDSISYNSVQELILKVPGLSGAVQMEKMRKEGKDLLVIRIETDCPESDYESLTKEFNQKFLDDRPSFKEFIKKGSVWPLKVELTRPRSLRCNPKTGKLIRVIDVL